MIFLLNPINYSLKSLPLFSIQLSFSLSTLKLSSNLLHFIILIIINFLILTNQQDEKTFVQTNSVINIDNHVIDLCQQDCSQRINQHDELDMACNQTCKTRLCQMGCHYWYLSPTSCFQACHNRSTNRIVPSWPISLDTTFNIINDLQENYCAVGCNHGHTVYLEYVKLLLELSGSLMAPRLIPNSLTNNSLSIEWNILPNELSSNVSWEIQWKFSNIPSKWLNVGVGGVLMIDSQLKIESTTTHAQLIGLNAYTGYQFRLQWIIQSTFYSSLYSESTAPITTLPYGVPKSGCIIVNCIAISSSQISVSWRSPLFSNGPIIAYSLYLLNEQNNHRIVKDIRTHWDPFQADNITIHNYLFNQLDSNTNYTVSIVTHNNFGEGPRCFRRVSTFPVASVPHYWHKNNPKDEQSSDQNKLYLATTKSVSRLNELWEEEILYHLTDYIENGDITGMAIHVRRRYLFVADSSGVIRRILLNRENSINQVLRIINGSNQPSHLNVDWLNDCLYWLEESNRLMRSSLSGDSIESIYINAFQNNQKPIDFKVDPYNGYLFWLQTNVFNRTVVYRLDLYYLRQSGTGINIDLRSKIELIYQSDSIISAFAIDFLNYRLVFPMLHTKTIHSITIDGNDEMAIRDDNIFQFSDMESPLVNVENMIIYNQQLYLIRGQNIFWEEYHANESSYYHNYYGFNNKLISLALMDAQSQPIPVPLTPVESVEAIFLDTSAKISWQKPALFGSSGRGAWQDWNYEVSIKESSDPKIVHLAQVNNVTQCDAMELRPNTQYEINVRAFTISANGTWSAKFVGKTLPPLGQYQKRPYALIATKDGLITTELDGNLKQQLISKSKLNGINIIGIEMYEQLIVLNTNKQILLYDASSELMGEHQNMTILINDTNAHCIAVEWMAGKLYWSNPTERMISRCNLNGTQIEILPIITYAQELAIDSINGFLYWSTLSSLRISLLNGMKHSQHLLIRTSQINSLSIDENEMKLYWLTYNSASYSSINAIDGESHSTLMLYQMPLFKTLNEIEQFHNSNLKMIKMFPIVQANNLIGPMAVFAGQFWWLDSDNRRMMISDNTAYSFATVRQISDINTFKIITNRSVTNMAKLSQYQVIPESVNSQFIEIVGSWENFTIKWLPVTNVNYGQVFYELSLENLNLNHTTKTNNVEELWPSRSNFIMNKTEFILPDYLKPPKPYSKIRIAIRSFTYWCSAKQVVVTLHTPSSVPSKPRSVRVFSYSMTNAIDAILADNINIYPDQFMADARWSEPENPNGPIISYTISLWTVGGGNIGGASQQYQSKASLSSSNNNVISIINKVIGNELHYKFYNLKANCTYYFQVRATTDVGEGPPSDVIQFKTFNSHPPMRLLLASRDSIFEADMDLLNIRPIIKSFSPYIIDYSLADDTLYFVEDGNFLKSTKLKNNMEEENNNYTVLGHFPETITSMSVDWISRRIYISSVDVMKNVSTIWSYQPETETKETLLKIVGKRVQTVRVDPFRSMLIWSEQVPIYSTIQINKAKQWDQAMVSYRRCNLSINGTLCTNVANYFQSPSRQRLCNCTHTPSISTVFLLLSNQNNHLQRATSTPQSLLSTLSAQMIIYFDLLGQTFIKSIDGCYCQRITSYIDTKFPPQSIQYDENNNKLYWINETVNAIIYSTQLTMASLDADFRQSIEAINLSVSTRTMIQIVNQPFPKQFQCLIPNERFKIAMNLLEQTSTSLKLRIDLERFLQSNKNQLLSSEHLNCPTNMPISLANIRFRIHYRTLNNDKNEYSNVLETYNQTITIYNLQPYTNYSFSIECDNYYYQLLYNRTRKQIEIAQNASLVPKMNNIIDLKNIALKFSYFYNETFIFGTSETRPAPPKNVHAIVETPERILILWDEPDRLNAQKVIYEIRWYSMQANKKEKYLNGDIQSWQSDGNRLLNGTFRAYLEKIQPGQQYSVTVRAYAIEERTINNAANGFDDNFFNDQHYFQDSAPIIVKSYQQPSNLQLKHSSSRQIVLTWQSPIEQIIDEHEIWYQLEQSDDGSATNWTKFAQEETMPSNQYQYQIKHLKPFRWYRFKLILTYRPSRFQYEWPKKPKIFRIQTNMTVPDGPASIEVEKINMNQLEQSNEINVYKVVWEPVQSNSDSIVYYQLYKLQLIMTQYYNQLNGTKAYSYYNLPQSKISIGTEKNSNNISGQPLMDSATQNGWTLVYNGTDTHWIISGLETGGQYYFRLYASNKIGVNDREWAQTIQLFRFEDRYRLYPTLSSLTQNEPSIIIIIFFIIGIISLCILGLTYYSLKFKIKSKKDLTNSRHQVELTSWPQRPHPHLTNTLYINSTAENIDLSDIEIFDFRSITLIKLLGKGAFGEVHEAILHKTEQRVAVKVLNKNSSKEEDNSDFLKEAKFMSKFKHPHILQLLGVCLNHHSSSIVIVLELMEAGDLLNYLRSNRPQSKQIPSSSNRLLTIDDLMSICIDIAKGCEYMEQKQFVHRDLAARNCLVSSVDPAKRVVKIADFGLTRGLYQQNYYRKEGGLMPVRWMSPESLSDGVFTIQSDVWSFSVIMYEVMTLGQQPYQAYSNKEVLEYVKYGGILERPPFCPFQMYSLMKQCWSYEKEARPSFSQILISLQQMRQQLLDEIKINIGNNLTAVHNQNYHSMQFLNGETTLPVNRIMQPTADTVENCTNLVLFTNDNNCPANRQTQPTLSYCNAIDLDKQSKTALQYNLRSMNGYSRTSTTLTTLSDHNSLSNTFSTPSILTISPTLVLDANNELCNENINYKNILNNNHSIYLNSNKNPRLNENICRWPNNVNINHLNNNNLENYQIPNKYKN